MLKKIVGIKNVGRFRNSASGGDTSLAKHSFIFGANGHGKTTICAILRSVKTGDASHVLGRKTLGIPDVPSVELLTSKGLIKFTGTEWDTAKPEIAIFDGTFISENVHSGDFVDSEQKRNLYRIIVGDVGVTLAIQEQSLAQESRAKTTEITKAASALQPHIQGMKIEDFIGLQKIDDIEQKLSTQESVLVATKEATSIKTRAEFTKVNIPELPADFITILSKSIDDIAKDAELKIQTHFIEHDILRTGADWIVQQIDHAKDSCPFCGQNIKDLPLISTYKDVFSEKYKTLRKSISSTKTAIEQTMGDAILAKLETFNANHQAAIEFWAKYCAVNQAELSFPVEMISAIKELRMAALMLIEKKVGEPLDAIVPDQIFLQAQATYEETKVKIQTFNQAIDTANSLITAQKKAVGAADLTAETDAMNRLKINQIRFSPTVIPLCDSHKNLILEQSNIETKKKVIRAQLDQHTKTVVSPYQKRINELLEDFNAEFLITETKHSYSGGSATSTYQLVINKTQIDLGSSNTLIHTPSFKNTLSAGDRSTLALAFFIAHLEREPDLAQKIVIFDDPFNSQDAFRRRQTIHEIIKIGKKCAQVLVLSHDPTFLKQIWDKCSPAERTSLALTDHRQQGTKILPHDIEKACQGRTATDTDDLQAFSTHGTGQHVDIIRKIRVVLETYMHSTYPALFNNTDWLGVIVEKIRNGGEAHLAACLYDELDFINDGTKQYHHGEKVVDTTPDMIDSQELSNLTRRTLRIVNAN